MSPNTQMQQIVNPNILQCRVLENAQEYGWGILWVGETWEADRISLPWSHSLDTGNTLAQGGQEFIGKIMQLCYVKKLLFHKTTHMSQTTPHFYQLDFKPCVKTVSK